MWYDFLTVGILAYATIRGAIKGIVWQLAVIASLIFCFGFAESLSSQLAPYISLKPPANRWVAMFLLYVGVSFLAFGAARIVRDWIEKIRFADYDRHLGAILGFLKGAVVCLSLTFFVVTLSAPGREHIMGSYSGHAAAIVMDRLHPVMPAELHDVLEPYIHQLDRPGMDLKHSHDDDEIAEHPFEDADAHNEPHDHDLASGHQENAPANDATGLASLMPLIFDPELQDLVLGAYQNTNPEHRAELIDKLSSGIPGIMRSVAQQWRDGKPDGAGTLSTEQAQLLREIGGVYADYPEAQAVIAEEIERSLSGLPDRVAAAVVRDWHDDLLSVRPDPDPETNAATSLDARIVRQLQLAGVPLNSLSSHLQHRLNETISR